MRKHVLTAAGVASLALMMSGTASHAGLGFVAGETLGTPLGAPLPEGVYATDIETYGRRDIDADHNFNTPIGPVPGGNGNTSAGPGPNVGVNIPVITWSTPITFYDTRLEFLYSAPFVHLDGGQHNGIPAGQTNRVDIFNQTFGPILAHNFGNGFVGGVSAWVRPPSEHFLQFTYADIRGSLSYIANGFDITATFGYTGTFGGHEGGLNANTLSTIAGVADAVDVDFTASKKFGKLELGFVGFAFTDINTRGDNSTIVFNGAGLQTVSLRQGAVAVGGLVGYDFGRFTVQSWVTREVAGRNNEIVPTVGGYRNLETRGFLRLVVPLYVAPAPSAASMVRARF